MVTSSAPGAEKSIAAVNSSVSLVKAGKRTLVIDCDIRKPTVHC